MLLGELELGGAPLLHTLKEAEEKFNGFIGKISKFGAIAGGGFAAFEGIHQIIEGFESVMSLSEHMNSLHFATGQSVHDLVILSHTLELAGAGADSAQNFIFKLQQAISGVNEEGKSTEVALTALGLAQKDLVGKSTLEQLDLLQKGFAKVTSQEDKAAIAGDLFGKRQGANALRILSNPEAFETAKKQAEPLAAVLDKNAAKFEELGHAISGLKMNLNEFFAGALQGIAPEATTIAEAMHSIDFVSIGEGVGQIASVFLQLFAALEPLLPLINGVAKGLDEMAHNPMLRGALGGAIAGTLFGPEGTVIGGILGAAGGLLFGSEDKHKKGGFADSLRGLDTLDNRKDAPVSALQRIGGGAFGFGGGDPLLAESHRHTELLQKVVENTSRQHTAHPSGIPGVFV